MSILKTIPIALDLKRVGAQAQALPTLVEGDNGNVFVITMTDDGEPLDLSAASRVICVFSKTSDGKTVEQDTEDANVALDDYGITVNEGETPALNDTITVINNGGVLTVNVSGTITGASVDAEKFLEKLPDDGTYVIKFNGTSWQYGDHSVTISGDDSNIITVKLKSASFGAGTNNCEVQIYSGNILVTTANFNFKGRKGIMNDETIQSEEKYPILVTLINEVSRVKSQSVLSVNGMSGDVVLSADDVGAVPTEREVNGHALSSDVTLDADDIQTDDPDASVQDALDTINDALDALSADGSVTLSKLAQEVKKKFTVYRASLTIPYSAWSSSGSYYTQTITITDATITNDTKVDIQPSTTVINQLLADGVNAMYIYNNNGSLIVYAIGASPTADLSVQVTYYETQN